MYFFVKHIEKTIILTPDSLGPNIETHIEHKLISLVEGKCHIKYGWIITVFSLVDCG